MAVAQAHDLQTCMTKGALLATYFRFLSVIVYMRPDFTHLPAYVTWHEQHCGRPEGDGHSGRLEGDGHRNLT